MIFDQIYDQLFEPFFLLQEQLRLCAEQSVLRAQTHATIALANQPRPLSFCSVMALKGFTYLPIFKGLEHRVSSHGSLFCVPIVVCITN